jgi:hypothetical protein
MPIMYLFELSIFSNYLLVTSHCTHVPIVVLFYCCTSKPYKCFPKIQFSQLLFTLSFQNAIPYDLNVLKFLLQGVHVNITSQIRQISLKGVS